MGEMQVILFARDENNDGENEIRFESINLLPP
jgi:hypothetical protein